MANPLIDDFINQTERLNKALDKQNYGAQKSEQDLADKIAKKILNEVKRYK